MNNKKVIYDLLSREENIWIKQYLLPIMSQLSSLRRDEGNGYFLHPLSEENIVQNLANFIDDAEEKLFIFEQRFSDYLTTKKVPLPGYRTAFGTTYTHKYCGDKFFMGDKTSERELKLHSPLAEMSKEELEAQVKQQETQFEKIFESIVSKAMVIKDIFLLEIFMKVLRDNLSEGYFRNDLVEVGKIVKDSLLKVINDEESFNTALENIKIEEWKKYLPEKNILVTQAVAHNFNSSSCGLVHFYIIQKNLAEYLYKKLLEVSSKFPEILKDAFENIDPQLRFQFEKLVFLELIQERYITGEVLTPLRLEEVKPFEKVMKGLQEEGYITISDDKIILTPSYKIEIPRMIKIIKEKRQSLIREFLNTSVNLSQCLVRDISEQNGEVIESTKKTGTSFPAKEKEFILLGSNEKKEWGILGKDLLSKKDVILDLDNTHTIFCCGVQGSGKSYTMGVICEMCVLKIPSINAITKPQTVVIFHYSRDESYAPEFITFTEPNNLQNELDILLKKYKANPMKIPKESIRIFIPPGKLSRRLNEYNDMPLYEIRFKPEELDAKNWRIVLQLEKGRLYGKVINYIIKELKENAVSFPSERLLKEIEKSGDLTSQQKKLATLRIKLINNYFGKQSIRELIKEGGINILDLRDENLEEDDALAIVSLTMDILKKGGKRIIFVLDEAHKYFKNRELTEKITELFSEMRHRNITIILATQNPEQIQKDLIGLSDILIIHKTEATKWINSIQDYKNIFTKEDYDKIKKLETGQALVYSRTSNTRGNHIIEIRPRVTLHGGKTKTVS